MYQVQIKKGCVHDNICAGEIISVDESAYNAFKDKFELVKPKAENKKQIEVKKPVEIDATNKAKTLAKENDIDLSTVSGSGLNGRIITSDIRELINGDFEQ